MEAMEENPSQSNTVEFVQWSKGNFEKIYSVSLFIMRFHFRHARVRPFQMVVWFWSTARIQVQQLHIFTIIGIAHAQ